MYKKKDINIKPYDGQDAFYSGTDEEYEEFLKNAEVSIDYGEEAEPVENTQRINLGETINLQNVIDKFKKTAGDLGSSAKTWKDNVVTKMEILKGKKEEADNESVENASGGETISDKIKNSVQNSARQINEIKEEVEAMSEIPGKVGGVDKKIDNVSGSLELLSKQLEALSDKLGAMDQKLLEDKKNSEQNAEDIKETVKAVSSGIAEIKQAASSVSRLNDSVFDLKNTQLNTKNAVSNLETAFARLKKKCVLGVTVLSILSAIVIVLEIVLMLS